MQKFSLFLLGTLIAIAPVNASFKMHKDASIGLIAVGAALSTSYIIAARVCPDLFKRKMVEPNLSEPNTAASKPNNAYLPKVYKTNLESLADIVKEVRVRNWDELLNKISSFQDPKDEINKEMQIKFLQQTKLAGIKYSGLGALTTGCAGFTATLIMSKLLTQQSSRNDLVAATVCIALAAGAVSRKVYQKYCKEIKTIKLKQCTETVLSIGQRTLDDWIQDEKLRTEQQREQLKQYYTNIATKSQSNPSQDSLFDSLIWAKNQLTNWLIGS